MDMELLEFKGIDVGTGRICRVSGGFLLILGLSYGYGQ